MICFPPSTFRLLRKYYFSGISFNLAFVYSVGADLHICSISLDVVNIAATEAIATLDSIYDTSNTDIGLSLRSITLNSGSTIVSLRNPSYSPPHPRDSRTSRTDFRIKLSRLAYCGRNIHANYSSVSKPRKYRCLSASVRLEFEMALKGLRYDKRIVWRCYMRERASWVGIVCDSHWDNEPFVVGVILQHLKGEPRHHCAAVALISHIIKDATKKQWIKKIEVESQDSAEINIYIKYDKYF